MVYTAQNQSLAALEVLVHLDSSALLEKYVLFDVVFDLSCMSEFDGSKLPKNWRASPVPLKLQAIGDDWVAGGSSAVLRVPSSLVPSESTFLLNPRHADFRRLRISKALAFKIDPRSARR